LPQSLLHPPGTHLPADVLENLFRFGGFPEPYFRRSVRFSKRWSETRAKQLFAEDLRDLTRIPDLSKVEHVATLLSQRIGSLTSMSKLGREVRASSEGVRNWLQTLQSFYFCFVVRPWYKNVARSLRKEPKYYLWDWSGIPDAGARTENFVACHLRKSVDYWNDQGLGTFGLHFLRDKDMREVDFLISKDGEPWILAEIKGGLGPLSPSLLKMQEQVRAPHAVQVSMELPAAGVDFLALKKPMTISVADFLPRFI
jgi:hypothetical protein